MIDWLRVLAIAALAAVSLGTANAQTSASPYTTGARYTESGLLAGMIKPDPDGAGPLHYPATRITYDGSGLAIKLEKGELLAWQSDTVAPANWSNFTVSTITTNTYDGADRRIKTVVEDSNGAPVEVTQYSYDSLGRLECTAVRMNAAVFGGLPNSACVLSTPGSFGPDRITRNIYDAAGQLIQVRKAVGTSDEQASATYTYSANGKQTSVTDANGNRAGLSYDGFDRLTQWYFPSPSVPGQISTSDYEEYGYDENNNRTSLRKRDGRTITFSYDNLNRVIVKIVPDACVVGSGYACTNVPATMTRDVYYNYDLRGLPTSARFDSASGTDAVINDYDGFGRVISTTTSMTGISRTLAFEYDSDGNRTKIIYSDGVYFTYSYDGLDRAITVRELGTTIIASLTYDALSRLSGHTRGAVNTTFTYDASSRLAGIADDLPGSTSDLISAFTYNPAGQIASRARSNDAYSFTGFVPVNRAYAANGLNQYTAAGSTGFGYDSNGNLTASGSTSYTYDAENRLVVASTGANLVYDPLGRLVETNISGGSITRFLYDGDQLAAEYSGSGVVQRRYVHGPGDDDPLLWYEGIGLTDRRSLQIDHQGSIVSVVNSAGTATIYSYDEYGIPGALYGGRFQYTGQAFLPELGMYYYKARIYSPTLGRFLQTDPIGYDGGINLYAYVGNDPVNLRDPSGNCPTCQDDEYAFDQYVQTLPLDQRRAAAETHYFGQLEVSLTAAALVAPEILFTRLFGVTVRVGNVLYRAGNAASTRMAMRRVLAEARALLPRLARGEGRVFAGAGSRTPLRVADRLAQRYGGSASDYQAIASRPFAWGSNGANVEVHAFRNVRTGQIVEAKLKVQGGQF